MDAKELLKRSANGETKLINANLNGVNLLNADLIGIGLNKANLSYMNVSKEQDSFERSGSKSTNKSNFNGNFQLKYTYFSKQRHI